MRGSGDSTPNNTSLGFGDNVEVYNGTNATRQDYLQWDEYFMVVTLLEGRNNPQCQQRNAAIIINSRQIIISRACDNEVEPELILNDNVYVNHVEFKALQKTTEQGVLMYVTNFPCEKCAQAITDRGILNLVYLHARAETVSSRKIFEERGVQIRQFSTNRRRVIIDFNEYNDDSDEIIE